MRPYIAKRSLRWRVTVGHSTYYGPFRGAWRWRRNARWLAL